MIPETSEFFIADLKNSFNQTKRWDGVRNCQVCNFMRNKMRIEDRVMFYYSLFKLSVVGTAGVVKTEYPDFTA